METSSRDPLHIRRNDRYLLQDRYLELTRGELPAAAARGYWCVRDDHCFMRILLDHLFQDCWYKHLDRRLKAYKQLNTDQLQQAITLGERILTEGNELLADLNAQSLAWRRRV